MITEHPWGGDEKIAGDSRCITRKALALLTCFRTALICLAGLMTIAASSWSQQTAPDSKEHGKEARKLMTALDRASQEVADEYLDILEQLQSLLDDYSDYLEGLDEKTRHDHRISVENLNRGLRDGLYVDSYQQLLDDIDDLIDEIKRIENRHKVEYETNRPRCCRVIRNLRRELVMLADLIEDYTDQQVVQILGQHDIKDYISKALETAAKVLELQSKETHLKLEKLNLPDIYVEFPEIPDIRHRVDPDRSDFKDLEGTLQEYTDTVSVTSTEWPIFISNPTGGVHVSGSDDNYILATLTIEISADNRTEEKKLIKQAELKVSSTHGRYSIIAHLPHLSDSRNRVLQSVLTVSIPAANHIECKSAFGDVSMTDLEGGILLESNYSRIELDNIRGKVNVTNSMKPITVSNVTGPLTVKNSYGDIDISSCDGDMRVENAYALVSLQGNRGDVHLKNSGQIQVFDHRGQVDISNNYGLVEVNGIDGDVFASNAYQPLNISEINGVVRLANQFAEINVDQINGNLTAENMYGPILAEALSGPIDLSNDNGNITVVLGSDLSGNSSITMSFGTVSLFMPDRSDLLVKARTIDGQISSSLPIKIIEDGRSVSAELKLGRGSDILAISGSNTMILINEQ